MDREPTPARTATDTLRWVSASSTLEGPRAAAEEAASVVLARLGSVPVDLALVFFTAPLSSEAESLAEVVRARLHPRCFAAVSASAVITADREIESGPALVLLAGHLPGVTIHPFVLVSSLWGDAMADAAEFARHTAGVADAELVLLFGDPFSLDVAHVLAAFQQHAPRTRVVGGMASAASRPNGNTLLLNDWQAHDGGIAISLGGALRADAIVSQGCRPIGPALEVTQVEGNVIRALDGRPALERTEEVLNELPELEREHLRHGIYLGRPARGGASGRGDYVIRNLMGTDRGRGIAVADLVQRHEQVRFHIRDARIARKDLELVLSPQVVDSRADAALIFSCNGRGRALFGEPNFDVSTVQSALGGAVPTAGFFCAGEIGPVGEENFLHGHAASVAILRSRPAGA